MRVLSVTALALLLASGCGQGRYQKAVKAGADAASAGAWEEAIARYSEARSIKPSDEIDARIADAQARAVEAALISARSAMREGDYETVVERLRFARANGADDLDISSLEREVHASLLGRASRSLTGGYPETAYVTAMRHKKLFPGSEEGQELLEKVRTHYLEVADSARQAGKYEEAMQALRAVLDKEPDQRARVADLLEDVQSAWASQLSQEASGLERAGRIGDAAIAYALAYAMTGVAGDRDNARRLAERLRMLGAFTVDLQAKGDSTRTRAFQEALENAGSTLTELVIGTSDHDLRLWLSAPEVRCSERSETQKKRRDYVSGHVDVRNPDRDRMEKEIADAERAFQKADQQANALWPRIESLREKVKGLAREAEDAERARADAQRKEQMAREQKDAAEALLEERQAALAQVQAGEADEADLKYAGEQVESAERNLKEWQEALSAASTDREKADKRYDEAARARDPIQAELDDLNEQYEAVIRLRDVHKNTRSELTGDLRHTPETVRQDVNEVFSYDEKHWTRTCSPRTYATAGPRWTSSVTTKQQYSTSRTTEDVSHRGHEPSGLREDPKEYPKTDAQLIAEADEETAAELVKWLSEFADEHYAKQREILVDDPLSTEGLSLYLGAPGRLEEAQKESVRLAARKKGIEDLDKVLLPGR